MPSDQDPPYLGSLPPADTPAQHPPATPEIQPSSQEEIAIQILRNQGREYDCREKELALEHIKQQNAFSYSEKALEKQSMFYMQESTLRHQRVKWVLITGVFTAISILGFLAALALSGHEKLAEELFKDVVLVFGGGAGGYGLSNRRGAQQQQTPPTSTNEQE